MNSSKIDIFEFPTNLGLKKKETDDEPGVKQLPEWLKNHGFHDLIRPERTYSLEPLSYTLDLDEDTQVLNADKIVKYASMQSNMLEEAATSGHFQLMVGGDCSVLIGSALALKQRGRYGLFFLDGHTDFVLPHDSQTKGAAGMDLALVSGHGPEKLTNISGLGPYFEEQHIYCVANREYDEDYLRPILKSDVHYVDLARLRKEGLTQVAEQFLEMTENQSLDGFFVHFDVDALNHEVMPAVDSPAPDGLTYAELAEILVPILSHPKANGMEITILDPTLDKTGWYTTAFVEKITKIIAVSKAGSD